MVIPIDRRLPGKRERELFAISVFYSESGKKFSAVALYLYKFKRKSAGTANVENSLYILITWNVLMLQYSTLAVRNYKWKGKIDEGMSSENEVC